MTAQPKQYFNYEKYAYVCLIFTQICHEAISDLWLLFSEMSMRQILKGKKYQKNNNNNNYPDVTSHMTHLSLDVLTCFFLAN